jgi:G3E family GTPase
VIPVTVLTGFLGSGKTTLLGRLLRHPQFARTAVIINEFGEIPLDHDLIETSGEQFVRLSNGCLCCNVRSDLTLTLGELAKKRRQAEVPAFERVVIETSGLADPAPILHTLMADRELNGLYALERVVTVVDAVLGARTLDAHATARRQAAVADCIVLSKTDLAQACADEATRRLLAMNPAAAIVPAVLGEIDPALLFSHTAPASKVHGHHGDEHSHQSDITSFTLVLDEPLAAATLSLLLSALAENCGNDLLRMKGIVNVAEHPRQPAVIHGVQHVYHAPQWLPRWPSEDRRTRLVFIARGVKARWVRALITLLQAEVDDTQRHTLARTP